MKIYYRWMIAIFLMITAGSYAQQTSTDPKITPPPLEEGETFPLEILVDEANKPETVKSENRFISEFLNMLATLGFIIGLIFIVAWFLKKMVNNRLQQVNEASNIKVLEQRALSQRTSIYVLEVYGKNIVIADSQNGVACLSEFTPLVTEEQGAREESPDKFSKLLDNQR